MFTDGLKGTQPHPWAGAFPLLRAPEGTIALLQQRLWGPQEGQHLLSVPSQEAGANPTAIPSDLMLLSYNGDLYHKLRSAFFIPKEEPQ